MFKIIDPDRPVYGLDWGGVGKGLITYDGQTHQKFKTLDKFLETLETPSIIVTEVTAESYNLKARDSFYQRCNSEGHLLYFVNPRQTLNYNRRSGIEKSDAADAEAIYHLAFVGHIRSVRSIRPPDNDFVERFDLCAKDIHVLRRSMTTRPATRGSGTKTLSEQDRFAEQLADLIPFDNLTTTQKLAFGNGEKYAAPRIVTVAVIARWVKNRKEFDALSGLSAHGYPSLMRSNLVFWAKNSIDAVGKSTYRREIRWLYHHYRNSDIIYPDIIL